MSDARASLLADLQERAFREFLPLHVSLELTRKCNLRCLPCYNLDRNAPFPPGPPELEFQDLLELLDDLRTSGTLFLSLTGGEPMIHPRFWDVLRAAGERRFAVLLLTNGTLLDGPACDRLSRHPHLLRVSLTLYGATAETHDRITQVRGSFDRTVRGLRRLRELGPAVTIKFLLLKPNVRETRDMMLLARQNGVPFLIDPAVSPRIDGTAGPPDLRLEPEDLEPLYRGPLRPLLTPANPDSADADFRCLCARGNAAVSATGEVWPCIAAPIPAGNIRHRRFPRIWKDSPVLRRIRRLRPEDFKTCRACPLKAWCHRNAGNAFLLSGDYTGPDPWACREAEVLRRILEG